MNHDFDISLKNVTNLFLDYFMTHTKVNHEKKGRTITCGVTGRWGTICPNITIEKTGQNELTFKCEGIADPKTKKYARYRLFHLILGAVGDYGYYAGGVGHNEYGFYRTDDNRLVFSDTIDPKQHNHNSLVISPVDSGLKVTYYNSKEAAKLNIDWNDIAPEGNYTFADEE